MGVHDNVYSGKACVGMVLVSNNGQKRYLKNRDDLKDYVPEKSNKHPVEHFDWGCDSPACYQLGLSILANEFGDSVALHHHRKFTEMHICRLSEKDNWEMDSDELEKIMMHLAS